MGDFEMFFMSLTVFILSTIIYNIFNSLSILDFIKRYGNLGSSRRDFYECGFKPKPQRPVQIPMQFVLICVFFILYDVELIFLLPYVAGFTQAGAYDSLLFFLFFILFLFGLIFDFERHALYWKL